MKMFIGNYFKLSVLAPLILAGAALKKNTWFKLHDDKQFVIIPCVTLLFKDCVHYILSDGAIFNPSHA